MSKNTKTTIIVSLAAAVLIGGAVFTAAKFKNPVYPALNEVANGIGQNLSETSPVLRETNLAENLEADVSAADAAKSDIGKLEVDQTLFKTYNHAGYGFSFDYPDGWSVDLFKDEDADAVAVENQETGIIILIYPFPEPGPISRGRILKDVPDLKIENEIALKVAGLDALGFESDEREFGPAKEVWFIHNGFLYQISAAAGSGAALEKMIATWELK